MKFLFRMLGRRAASAAGRLGDTGLKRGLGGNGVWMAVAVVVGGFRFMGRLGKREREVVFSKVLEPGEAFKIAHLLEDRKGRPVG